MLLNQCVGPPSQGTLQPSRKYPATFQSVSRRQSIVAHESIFEQYGRRTKFRPDTIRKRWRTNGPTHRLYPQPGFLGTNAGEIDWWHEVGYHQRAHIMAFEKDQYVIDVMTKDKDGYSGVLVGYKEIPPTECPKHQLEKFERVQVPPLKWLRQFRVARDSDVEGFEPGQKLEPWNQFKDGDLVDIGGISKIRGFQGIVSRFRARRGPETHGGRAVRSGGSVGTSKTPGKVLPFTKMPGDKGCNWVMQRGRVLKVDAEERVLIVSCSLPGDFGSICQVSVARILGRNYFPPKEELISRPWWARNLYQDIPLEF